MANLYHGPKIRQLTTRETLSSIENWKSMVIYGLRLNQEFRPYLDIEFGRKSKLTPNRQLTADVRTETNEDGTENEIVVTSAEEKAEIVDLLLEQIANYAPTVPRNDIVKDSKSLKEVWSKIKLQYNQQQTGSLLNDCWNIKRQPDETPQALYARLKQAYDECLLTEGGLKYIDGPLEEDEEMSPTLHNVIILQWLELLHPKLRQAVTQKFVTQLRDQTYASLYPEISRSIEAILDDIESEASISRLQTSFRHNPNQYQSSSKHPFKTYKHAPPAKPQSKPKKHCDFCKVTGRKAYFTHSIEDCLFVKKFQHNTPSVKYLNEEEEDDYNDLCQQYEDFYQYEDENNDNNARTVEHVISRVSMDASPVLTLMKNQRHYNLTIDSGATCNCISKEKAKEMGAIIHPTNHRVRMADGQSYLPVAGETKVTLYRNNTPLQLSAVVCEHLDTDILAGMEFMRTNDVGIRPAFNEISIGGTDIIKYDPARRPNPQANRLTTYTVKADHHHVLLPGESISFSMPNNITGSCAIEPRWDSNHNRKLPDCPWPPPQILPIMDGKISIANTLNESVILKKLEHVCQAKLETLADHTRIAQIETLPRLTASNPSKPSLFSSNVVLNRDIILPKPDEQDISNILKTYDTVFDPKPSTYNGKSGPCYVEVNLGKNLPPQRKGKLPFYGKDDLAELQQKFDDLTEAGILSRPQEIGITVENTNPSFLVKKQPPSIEKRLVTDFSSISEYCRPTPSVMPDVESTLRTIGGWSIIAKTDMSNAYFQIKMKKSSKKFCGVHTPYKGLRVYNVGVMGLPGVEVALEELTSLILGDMVAEGKVAKLADDLFIGGKSTEEFKQNLQDVLIRLYENNIKLKASKTIIAPKEVTILGWIWSQGKLKASPHRLLVLSTCKPPETTTAMKSFLGSYRFLSRTIKGYASLLKPLEEAIKGKEPKNKIEWTENLLTSFKKAQKALSSSKAVTIPRPSDSLVIVTDASVKPGAVGAILYAIRNGTPLLAGFYNSKLPEFQQRWLPCEMEGLAISVALNHFAPYIIQSNHKPQIVTDSKPCVDAVTKLKLGQFSTSARLSAFLSAVSRHQATIKHQAGSNNIPADYLSRHPIICSSADCSICKFVSKTTESVVQNITIEEVSQGTIKMPFTNRNAWKSIQDDCKDLRRVNQFRKNGTTPSKKTKNLRQVRRYLSAGILLAHDGLLVLPHSKPMKRSNERIVVPQQVLYGILTALHLKFNHPTAYQLTKIFTNYFFCLNMDQTIKDVTQKCHQCASLKEIPNSMVKQTTDDPPSNVAAKCSADIVKRHGQKILVIREVVSAYTLGKLISDETSKSVSEGLVELCNILRPAQTADILIKVDPASAHKSLFKETCKSSILIKNNIHLELGRPTNPNKNPIIDKCIKELHREINIIKPEGGPISSSNLSIAIANLNTRYRRSGLSAHEIWTQRDQLTGEQLPLSDRDLIIEQHEERLKNHPYSEKSKAPGKPYRTSLNVPIGTLVYLYVDKDKTKSRPRYIVTHTSPNWYKIRRFTTSLIGQEYEIKPDECYTIPNIDDIDLKSESDNESSSDENPPFLAPHSYPKLIRNRAQRGLPSNHSAPSDPDDNISSSDTNWGDYDRRSSDNRNGSSSDLPDSDEDSNGDADIDSDSEYNLNNRDLPRADPNRPQRARRKPDRYGL